MKKMMMMVVVAACSVAANAQTPCHTESCEKTKTVHCDVQSEPCCDSKDCLCPEGTQNCGTDCQPCNTTKEKCKTDCSHEVPADSTACAAKKSRHCHHAKHSGCKSGCNR